MVDKINLDFTLNGHEVSAAAFSELNLMRFLRDELDPTGTKNGSKSEHCGAITAFVDGKASRLTGSIGIRFDGPPFTAENVYLAMLDAGIVK